jgi:hypothetical protein
MKRISILLLIVLACLVTAAWPQAPALAKHTIITFDPPGPPGAGAFQGTQAPGLNSEGAITGFYSDSINVYHGFLRNPDGTMITFDAPDAGTQSVPGFVGTPMGVLGGQGTYATAINKAGAITGFYVDIANTLHGFLRAPDGTITEFDVLGAGVGLGLGTEAGNINTNGTIAGDYFDVNNVAHGYLRTPRGKFITFDVPGAGTNPGQGTIAGWASCITGLGAVTGWFIDANNVVHGWVRDPHGIITTIDAPGAGTAAYQGTYSWSMNPAGSVTGVFVDSWDVEHGFLRTRDGSFTEFDVPRWGGSPATVPEGISPMGVIIGNYSDANGMNHGFLRARDGAISKFNVPAAGKGMGQGTVPLTNNTAGNITGSYFDANNVIHGFLVIW